MFDFMFEVHLREDYEDIYKFREVEKHQQDLSRSRAYSVNTSHNRGVNTSFMSQLVEN